MNLSSACCWGCSSASRRCASREGRGTGRVCCHWLWASLVLGEKMLSKIHSEKFWKMRGDVTSSVFNDMLMCWRTNLKDVILWYCMIWLVLTVNVLHAWNALSCNVCHHSSFIGSKHLQLWLIYSSSPGSSLDFYVKISFFSRSSYYQLNTSCGFGVGGLGVPYNPIFWSMKIKKTIDKTKKTNDQLGK